MKLQKIKRVLSLLLCVAMCLSFAIVAQAEGEDTVNGSVDSGVYYIVSNDGSGKEIVIDAGNVGGMKVALDSICWTRENNTDHHWRIEPTGNSDGSYYLRNIKSDLVLTPRREKDVVVDGAFFDESYLESNQPEQILEQQVKRENDPIQQWIFEPVEGEASKYRIRNAKSGGYIEIASYTLDGWRVGTLQAPLDESKNSQIWTLEELPGDHYVYTDINKGSISPRSPKVTNNSSQTFSITAELGHHIERILIDGEAIEIEENLSSYNLTVENITGDKTVEVITAKNDYIVYTPGNNFPGRNKSLSPRLAEAADGTLYSTFEWGERSDISREYCFPIYKSTDKGLTWNKVGEVINDDDIRPDVLVDKSTGEIVDTPNANTIKCNWQLQNCPQIYILPEDLGDLAAGTIICAGNNVLIDEYAPKVSDGGDGGLYKTELDLYYSTDDGRTWDYLSNIDYGGVNRMGYDPVWEPFFLFYENQLICYYSDEKVYDYTNNQQLVHKITTDGVNWSEAVVDVKMNWTNARPGMPIVSQLENGKWIYTYEGVGTSTVTGLDSYYKISDNPLDWGDNKGNRGSYLWRSGAPYVFTLKDGRVVANTSATGGLLFNTNNDASGEWIEVPLGISGAYNRQTYQLTANGSDEIIIIHSDHSDGRYIRVSLFNPDEIGIDDEIMTQQYITNKESSEVIGIWQGSTSNGSLCVTWSNTASSDQKWLPVDQGDGTYAFTNVNSGLALTAKENGDLEQRTLETEENDIKLAQSWVLEESEDNSWTFKNIFTGKYLSYQKDTSQPAEVDRYKVIQVEEVTSDAQRWTFNKVYSDGKDFELGNPIPEPEYLIGDVNRDGAVNLKDVLTIQKYAAYMVEFDDVQMFVADVNVDKKVTLQDALMIQRWIVKLITSDYINTYQKMN